MLTGIWAELSDGEALVMNATHTRDGAGSVAFNFSQPLAPSLAAWAGALVDKTPEGDPDHDGLSNLMEYAFGADPAVSSPLNTEGTAVTPAISRTAATWSIRYARRTDATARGLVYTPEYADASMLWSTTAPAGVSFHSTPPSANGMVVTTITMPLPGPVRFARVRVTLSE